MTVRSCRQPKHHVCGKHADVTARVFRMAVYSEHVRRARERERKLELNEATVGVYVFFGGVGKMRGLEFVVVSVELACDPVDEGGDPGKQSRSATALVRARDDADEDVVKDERSSGVAL